ncbi:hypothetical protein GTY41_21805 [Streptomyces sp. SID685]|nr:hypothetical protein [Streptomyces sp. SID685]
MIAGCSSAGTAGTTSAGADGGSAPVKVCLVCSRSRPLAAYGKQYEQGFKAGLAYATHGTDKVVLGGSGTRWGPMIGGILYTWADQRLGDLAGSGTVAVLPSVLRIPLSQPLFLLGALLVAVIYLLPGGVARLPARLRSKAPGAR